MCNTIKRKVQQIINKICGPVPKTKGSKNTAPGLKVNTKKHHFTIISAEKTQMAKTSSIFKIHST